jgi:hypothetical protein
VALAGAIVESLEITAHVDALGVPIPRPMKIVAGGPAAVSVTLTVPVCATAKGEKLTPPTGTVPVNVSVVVVAAGVVTVDVEFEPVQAGVVSANVRRNKSPCFMRRALCNPGASDWQSLAASDDLSGRQTDFAASFLEDSDDNGVTHL